MASVKPCEEALLAPISCVKRGVPSVMMSAKGERAFSMAPCAQALTVAGTA